MTGQETQPVDAKRLAEIKVRFDYACEDLAQLHPGSSVRESMEASLTDLADLIAEVERLQAQTYECPNCGRIVGPNVLALLVEREQGEVD